MIRNDVKVRQICTIFIAFLPLCKLVNAPAVFSGLCREKLWQPLILYFAADALLLALILLMAKKNPQTAFFDILKREYSEAFARVVFFVYAAFFMIKSFVPLCEYKYLIEAGFYEVMPQSEVFFPIFLITLFLSVKGLKVFARCSEFASFVTCAGLSVIFYLSVGSGDFANLMPIFGGSEEGVLEATAKNIFWFNDAAYILLFLGHFENEKKMRLKIYLSYAVSVVVTLFFFLCFYSVFYTVAPAQKNALSTISIFSVTLVNVGRFDFLALFMLLISAVFALALPLFAATKCLCRSFKTKRTLFPGLAVNGAAFIAVIFFSNKLNDIIGFYQVYFAPFMWICGYLLPLLGLKGCFKKTELKTPAEKNRKKLKGENGNELQTG